MGVFEFRRMSYLTKCCLILNPMKTHQLWPFSLIALAMLIWGVASCSDNLAKTSQVEEDPGYNPEAVLDSLGIELPTPSPPVANYVNAVQTGDLLFLAGKGPRKADGTNVTGKLGHDLTIEEGYAAGRLVAINHIGVLKAELGDLKRVKRIVRVMGMVNSDPAFEDQPKVVNGYSDLMVTVFGDRGKHARAAVGMAALPGNIAVEVEAIVEIE